MTLVVSRDQSLSLSVISVSEAVCPSARSFLAHASCLSSTYLFNYLRSVYLSFC